MSENLRPDPDALLAELRSAEGAEDAGRLKIFLGMSPGVGKTYAMLLAGQTKQEEGVSTVIGFLETHGRVETAAVAAGLPRIPRKIFEHRGVTIEEMDIDGILARRPQLVLVDELAHSNAAGSRHPKRWQDVMEILAAGIDVYSTLNVQHIESYRDVVRQITGAPINETVSDAVLDRADEIELVDLTAEQLRKRLEEGKVYLGERAAAASANFFREGNLKALREIALRITAEKADRDLRRFRDSRRITTPWRSRERLLVAVGTSPFSERLIRLTRRSAAAVHAPWVAVYVDTGGQLDAAGRARLESNLSLARELGAEVVMTSGTDVSEALLRVGRQQNVSQILVGKPLVHPWREWLSGGSLVSRLIRRSGDIDIYVVRADKAVSPWRPRLDGLARPSWWREIGMGVAVVTATTLLCLALEPVIGYSAAGLILLASVVLSASLLSRWSVLFTAAFTALAWNFLLIPPTFTFHIRNAHDMILCVMYFVIALVLGHLHARLRQRERTERDREQQAVAFAKFSRVLAASPSLEATLREAAAQIQELFSAVTAILVASNEEKLRLATGPTMSEREMAVAAWCMEKGQMAGRFTDTLPESGGFYVPLRASNRTVGVLAAFAAKDGALTLAQRQMLETLGTQLAMVIEHFRLQGQAEQSRVEENSRRLQKTLLDSVSHEFQTPLAVISTALDRLDESGANRDFLTAEIRTAVRRLERILGNLLDMTRIETGAVKVRREWCDLHEIVHAAIDRVTAELGPCHIQANLPEDAVEIDPGLLEEVIVNLLRNAVQYSPPAAEVQLDVVIGDGQLHLHVRNEGTGLEPEEMSSVFEKFSRGKKAMTGGLGLGLSIVKGFMEALGGTVSVRSRIDGRSGAEFVATLPVSTRSLQEMSQIP